MDEMGKDIDANNNLINISSFLTSSKDGYYFMDTLLRPGKYLYYYDFDSDTSAPLCGKAQCAHNDEKCNAYAENYKWGPIYYDQRIYCISNEPDGKRLYSCALDGSGRKLEFLLQNSDLFPTGDCFVTIHRGFLIAAGSVQTIINGVAFDKRVLMVWPLNGKGKAETLYLDADYQLGTMVRIYLSGEYLYYAVGFDLNPDEEKEIVISRFHLDEWTDEQLIKTKSPGILFDFKVKENTCYISCVNDGKVYMYNMDEANGTFGEVVNLNKETGNEFSHVWLFDDLICGSTRTTDGRRYVLYDMSGNLISDNMYKLTEFNSDTACILGADGRDILVAYETFVSADHLQGTFVKYPAESREELILYRYE